MVKKRLSKGAILLIQRCKNCFKEFDWKIIIESIWLKSYAPIKCDECKSMHHSTIITRLLIGFSVGVVPFIILKIEYKALGAYCILVYLMWIVFMVALTPFYARYYIKDKDVI